MHGQSSGLSHANHSKPQPATMSHKPLQTGYKTAAQALTAWRNHRDRLEAREQANRTADRTGNAA